MHRELKVPVNILSRLTGTLTRWHLHPAEWLHRLPDSVSFEEGSLCEPLAVALAGIERSGLRLGDSTLIWYFGLINRTRISLMTFQWCWANRFGFLTLCESGWCRTYCHYGPVPEPP